MPKIVYADNAATSALSKTALEAMMPFLSAEHGNPSSLYGLGRSAKRAVESARVKVASAIGARAEEIYFTSGGTEADNWAIESVARLKGDQRKHIITCAIEHHAVLCTLRQLEKLGYEVTYLGVDETGHISLEDLRAAIRSDTILITIMAANNEIGTILPTAEIGAIARAAGVLFHTDAVQAVGHIPINVDEMKIDLLSLSAHKFQGPKGVGALYVRKGLRLPPGFYGGGQERGLRAGTENVAGIVGMATALKEATDCMPQTAAKVTAMRDRLIEGLLKIPGTRLTGDPKDRLPGIASFVFECIEGETLVLLLDQNSICASSGPACSSGALDPSHVLLAIGLPEDLARGSLRLSINEDNTDGDIDVLLEKLPDILSRLREISPVWQAEKSEV